MRRDKIGVVSNQNIRMKKDMEGKTARVQTQDMISILKCDVINGRPLLKIK
jgi:hypothetical protein